MSLPSRLRAAAAFRTAQRLSWAGRHETAEREFHAAERLDPALPNLHLQAAIALARRGKVEAALERLDEAPEREQGRPAQRLFRGWFQARLGRPQPAIQMLAPLLEAEPENRVAATALAYAHLRAGDVDAALALLGEGPGDNFEVLSWTWLELERAAQGWPPPPDPPAPEPHRMPADERDAAALYRVGVAAVEQYAPVTIRRRLLLWARTGRWGLGLLAGLLERLEHRRPTDALAALLAARAGGRPIPGLDLYLGMQLYDQGHFTAALEHIDAAAADMAAAPERWPAHLEPWLAQLARAAVLVELRRWDEAQAALDAAQGEGEAEADEASAPADRTVDDYGLPEWHLHRATVRLARGDGEAARRDLETALEGYPALFDERLACISHRRAESVTR